MKNLLTTLFLMGSAVLAGGIVVHGRSSPSNLSSQTEREPVIVELFTSEGCSSCPSADTLLKKLEEQQTVGSAEIIALEEHVDYWNNLGWADPFSSPQLTARQQQYAESLRSHGPYTPQMIVDGRAEFVGSRVRQALQEIEAASRKPKAAIAVAQKTPSADRAGEITVRVGKLEGATAGDLAEVWLAITESRLHSAVTAGENSGEDLQHASVVRRLQKIGDATSSGEFSFSGEATGKYDSKWKRENVRVVIFVQEKKSRRTLAAVCTPLS